MALDTFALHIQLPLSSLHASATPHSQILILSAQLTLNCGFNIAVIKALRTSQEVQCRQELNTALVVTGLLQGAPPTGCVSAEALQAVSVCVCWGCGGSFYFLLKGESSLDFPFFSFLTGPHQSSKVFYP